MFGKDFAAPALILAATQAGVELSTAMRCVDFDCYVLAFSWQIGFCQSMFGRNCNEPERCRPQQDTANKADSLTVRGLWLGLSESIATRGVDERCWTHYDCATRPMPNMPEMRANRKRQAVKTGLSLEMANKLNNVMPGSGGTSCLECYEYAKHSVCLDFDPDSYSGTMVRLNGEIKHSPIGDFLVKHYGQTVNRADFDAAVVHAWGPQSVRAFKLTCNDNPACLTEVQISLNAVTIDAPLAISAFLSQPYPGNCGTQFILDKVGQQCKTTC